LEKSILVLWTKPQFLNILFSSQLLHSTLIKVRVDTGDGKWKHWVITGYLVALIPSRPTFF